MGARRSVVFAVICLGVVLCMANGALLIQPTGCDRSERFIGLGSSGHDVWP